MIKCRFKPLKKHGSLITTSNKRIKYGIYLTSSYPIKKREKRCWIVGVNIELDYTCHIKDGKTNDEIVEGCIEYLNTPPKRKRKPLYGLFESKPYKYSIKKSEDGEIYIQLLLLANLRKNKQFWGVGTNIKSITVRKKRTSKIK